MIEKIKTYWMWLATAIAVVLGGILLLVSRKKDDGKLYKDIHEADVDLDHKLDINERQYTEYLHKVEAEAEKEIQEVVTKLPSDMEGKELTDYLRTVQKGVVE